MKALKLIGVIVGGLVLLFLIVAAILPSTYQVERSIVINQPAEAVQAFVSEYKNFSKYSPWNKLDPTQQVTISEKSSGVGATYEWKGNDKVGHGKMTTTVEEPGKYTEEKLEFFAPWKGVSIAYYKFEPTDGGTKVIWGFKGDSDYPMGRYMGTMMDGMMGPVFDGGLKDLKAAMETGSAQLKPEAPKEEIKK